MVVRYWRELVWLTTGALVWTVTQPLRTVTVRLFSAVSYSVYKWAGFAKVCIQRYRRYVRGSGLQNLPRGERWWKSYDALWAIPMVVLEARRDHLDGVGCLLRKWIDAFHAYWGVFHPDSLEYSWHSTVKYWNGLKIEYWRTVRRACFAGRAAWTVASLLIYAAFYEVLFLYEIVE